MNHSQQLEQPVEKRTELICTPNIYKTAQTDYSNKNLLQHCSLCSSFPQNYLDGSRKMFFNLNLIKFFITFQQNRFLVYFSLINNNLFIFSSFFFLYLFFNFRLSLTSQSPDYIRSRFLF